MKYIASGAEEAGWNGLFLKWRRRKEENQLKTAKSYRWLNRRSLCTPYHVVFMWSISENTGCESAYQKMKRRETQRKSEERASREIREEILKSCLKLKAAAESYWNVKACRLWREEKAPPTTKFERNSLPGGISMTRIWRLQTGCLPYKLTTCWEKSVPKAMQSLLRRNVKVFLVQ